MDFEYVDTHRALTDLADRLAGVALVGVDTEAAGYHRFLDRLSLVQVSTRTENFLIDPIAIEDLSPLAPLLADGGTEKIFHDADYDLRILHRDAGLEVSGLFDSQIAAAFIGDRSLGLGAVVEKHLGIKLPKAYQRADWAERPLSEPMLEYASTDTVHLPSLRDTLRRELEGLGRLAWAEEEFARREKIRWNDSKPAHEAFLRMKGARDLSPRGLAILRELFKWRDDIARERDRAAFRVLANQALLSLSLRAPTTVQQIAATENVPGWVADRAGNDVLDAIRRGLATPEKDLPRFPVARRWERDPEVELRGERLRKVRSEVSATLGLDPGFLMSRAVLDEVARRNPRSAEELGAIPEVRQWQVEALGERLLHALA